MRPTDKFAFDAEKDTQAKELVGVLGKENVEVYSKAAIVGVDGELEHAGLDQREQGLDGGQLAVEGRLQQLGKAHQGGDQPPEPVPGRRVRVGEEDREAPDQAHAALLELEGARHGQRPRCGADRPGRHSAAICATHSTRRGWCT